ncbi:hypothetical protein EDB80DRAFT_899611 [Ilyonectria destructans]|nr:hypothetical protein EDB80DRAFT_899611 [Ilyonectria destructans]
MASVQPSITASIDFGSSYVRASFNNSHGTFNVRMVRNWHTSDLFDGSGNNMMKASEEFPTSIYFSKDAGAREKFSIGHHIGETVHSGLKAALDPEMSKDGAGAIFRQMCTTLGVEPFNIFKAVMSRTVDAMTKTLNEEFRGGWEWRKLIFTLPVLWTQGNHRSDTIQGLYRQALTEAGVPDSIICPESEAEASVKFCTRHKSLQTFVGKDTPELEKIFFVDIGEGTWDALLCVIKNSDGEFAQIGESIGGQGGMGSVWAKVKEKCTDPDIFGQVQNKFFRMETLRAIDNGAGAYWSEEEVRVMMDNAWNPVLDAIKSQLKGGEVHKLVMVGSATQNRCVQKMIKDMIKEIAGEFEAAIYFLEDAKPSTVVCRGAVMSRRELDPIKELEKSAFGLAIIKDGSETDHLVISKERGKPLEKLRRQFESISVAPGSKEVTIWPVYTEAETTELDDAVSIETNQSVHAFNTTEATYMDQIRLPLPHGDYNSILYMFSYDKSKADCMILETFNAFFYSRIALEIRGDASRVILQKDEKSFINLSQTELRSKDFIQRFAARSLRTKKNQSVTSSTQLLRDEIARVVDIDSTTTKLEVLCRAPIHGLVNDTLESAGGFYCCLKLPLPRFGTLKRLRLVSLAHDESPGFDLLLAAGHNLLHWGLEWDESNNTLQPSESSDDAAPLQELFELIEGKRLTFMIGVISAYLILYVALQLQNQIDGEFLPGPPSSKPANALPQAVASEYPLRDNASVPVEPQLEKSLVQPRASSDGGYQHGLDPRNPVLLGRKLSLMPLPPAYPATADFRRRLPCGRALCI